MIYLKQFENFRVPLFGLPNLKTEIDEILLDIKDDFPELEWQMLKDNAFYWKFRCTIQGIQKGKQYMKLFSNYFPEIKGRLLDINVISEISLRRIDMSNFEIVILIRQDI